ncbi:NADH dehydrogenase [ubiquinone] iron-sulfur protein 6, mitochondrial isoform X2 [Rhineura floridana]|uniref:NADH dehydrogenase [ubiquinone] iron-sulfur protein 6, mitochondrial isoform X2 n=1 Tax=Rhineura floridana TaxID=261503 RepID=UPI002AC820FC|nr:NADH dehydrogenase [ubiquinone] iron-sulfur protein 6, mitochondrial isoform X2 [Rhineura floridana]
MRNLGTYLLVKLSSESYSFTLVLLNLPPCQIEVYEESDYRQIRFTGRQKEVNENFAIDLIAEQPVSEVETRVVSCDGGGGALGHPKVYINLDKDTKTGTCGYCGLQFKQKHHH